MNDEHLDIFRAVYVINPQEAPASSRRCRYLSVNTVYDWGSDRMHVDHCTSAQCRLVVANVVILSTSVESKCPKCPA